MRLFPSFVIFVSPSYRLHRILLSLFFNIFLLFLQFVVCSLYIEFHWFSQVCNFLIVFSNVLVFHLSTTCTHRPLSTSKESHPWIKICVLVRLHVICYNTLHCFLCRCFHVWQCMSMSSVDMNLPHADSGRQHRDRI